MPIYFTYTGLRTEIGSMGNFPLWLIFASILAAAMLGKLGGCAAAARLAGMSWHDSSLVGVLMNTRALMELVVINIGFDLGLIPKSVFFMLVLMAVSTTYMTAPLVRHLIRSTELEAPFLKSEFMREATLLHPALQRAS